MSMLIRSWSSVVFAGLVVTLLAAACAVFVTDTRSYDSLEESFLEQEILVAQAVDLCLIDFGVVDMEAVDWGTFSRADFCRLALDLAAQRTDAGASL